MILLDTNVISELVRPRPEPAVEAYLRKQAPDALVTAAVCLPEIRYGLARMPAGRRRDNLAGDVERFLAGAFGTRVLPFDAACAAAYGAIRSGRESRGAPIEVEDAMIAATALVNSATVATRNASDFAACGVVVVNPWEHQA